jgi:hypothetical protein
MAIEPWDMEQTVRTYVNRPYRRDASRLAKVPHNEAICSAPPAVRLDVPRKAGFFRVAPPANKASALSRDPPRRAWAPRTDRSGYAGIGRAATDPAALLNGIDRYSLV